MLIVHLIKENMVSGDPTEFIMLAVMNICVLIWKIKLTDMVRKKLLKIMKD